MVVKLGGIIICFNEMQLLKQWWLIDVTEKGIDIRESFSQWLKAFSLIDVRKSGSDTFDNE